MSLDERLIARLAESCNKPAEEVRAALRDLDEANIRYRAMAEFKSDDEAFGKITVQ